MAQPFPAVDTRSVRSTERLAAFQTEWLTKKPNDQYFERYPTIDYFMKNCKVVKEGGAQLAGHIGIGESPNFRNADDYDEYSTSGTDLVEVWAYPWKLQFDSYSISFNEMRELAGKDHALFNRVGEGMDRVRRTLPKKLNEQLYAAAQATKAIQSMALAVDSTGTIGGIDPSAVTQWVANEDSATNLAGMYEAMKTLRDDQWTAKADPRVIFTTFAVRRYLEALFDPDVRYTKPGELVRGVSNDPHAIMFSNIPIIADADCTAATQYWIDPSLIDFVVDSACDMHFGEPEKGTKQWAYNTPFINRCQWVMKGRREQGKLTDCS